MKIKKSPINFVKSIYIIIRSKLNSKPFLKKFIYTLYDKLRLIEFKIKSLFFSASFSGKDNVIYVIPEKIKYEKDTKKGHWRLFLKFLKPLLSVRMSSSVQLIDGNWDLPENLKLFEHDIKYESYYQHFINGIDWNETSYYNREKERYLEGKFRKEYESVDELNLKYKYLDELFEKIEREGFKTQREIIESEGIISDYGRGTVLRKPDDDITVVIGRNGEIIFLDGRHRLNIAKMLSIKNRLKKNKIPVRILAIHPNFMNKIKNGDSTN